MTGDLRKIKRRQRRYAQCFVGPAMPIPAHQLSDAGWLGLVAVPFLLRRVRALECAAEQCQCGHAKCQPGADGLGLVEASLEFVRAEEAPAGAGGFVPSGNPLAKFFVGLLARVKWVVPARCECEADHAASVAALAGAHNPGGAS